MAQALQALQIKFHMRRRSHQEWLPSHHLRSELWLRHLPVHFMLQCMAHHPDLMKQRQRLPLMKGKAYPRGQFSKMMSTVLTLVVMLRVPLSKMGLIMLRTFNGCAVQYGVSAWYSLPRHSALPSHLFLLRLTAKEQIDKDMQATGCT